MRSLLCLMTFLMVSTAQAESKFYLGAGFNFNIVKTEENLGSGIDEEVSADLTIAGKLETTINEDWLFRTGLWLQEKSAQFSVDSNGIEGDLTINTIYLSIPLNLQYKASNDVGIFGGYVADLRINDYCDADGDFDDCWLEKDSESIVHNATLGVSIKGSERWTVDLSWQQGLSDVIEDGYKTHTFQAMAFYKF